MLHSWAHLWRVCLRHVYDCHVTPSPFAVSACVFLLHLPLPYSTYCVEIQIFASICVVLASGAVCGSCFDFQSLPHTPSTTLPPLPPLPLFHRPYPFRCSLAVIPLFLHTHTHTHGQLNGTLTLMTNEAAPTLHVPTSSGSPCRRHSPGAHWRWQPW